MLLLPLLAGLSFVLHGTSSYAVGVHRRYDSFQDLIKRINQYEQTLQEHKRKQNSYQQNIPAVRDGDYNVEKVDKEINLAAADAPADTDIANDPIDAQTTTRLQTTTTQGYKDPLPPAKHVAPHHDHIQAISKSDYLFILVVSACSVAGFVGLVMAGVCWYKLHSRVKAASDVDYPAYGVTGPTKERLPSPGDRKLAQSAQMYHYQHQKQQMIAMEKANGEMKQDGSEEESEEENEEGDYTVYECPGLAPTGEMEVRNPLFTEEAPTPVNGQAPPVNGLTDEATETQE